MSWIQFKIPGTEYLFFRLPLRTQFTFLSLVLLTPFSYWFPPKSKSSYCGDNLKGRVYVLIPVESALQVWHLKKSIKGSIVWEQSGGGGNHGV